MPRSSFARGALNGAASGGSKLFQAILNADKAYQDGYTKEELAQSRIAQAAGVTAKNNAAAAQDEAETAIINGRPEVFNETLAARGGVTVPQVRAYRDYLQTGVIPERQLPGPPTEDGVGPGAGPLINPEAMTKLGQLIGQLGLLQGNVKDLNPAQLADADSAYSTMGLRDQVLGGQRTPQSVSEAVAAAAGKYQQGGAAAKAPAGYQWAGDTPGVSLQPIPGGPKDPKVNPAKSASGKVKDPERIRILGAKLFDVRERMQAAKGDELTRLKADELALIAELKSAGADSSSIKAGAADAKPKAGLPTPALKLQQEELDAIGLSGGINADLGGLIGQIESGKLQLGPVENLISSGLNYAGFSSENSRNFQSAKATLEKIRNDSLRLNKGVQTEGDAVRAWNELLANLNDGQNVLQRLREIQTINQRGADLRRHNIDVIRQNYGLGPLETDQVFNQQSAVGAPKPGAIQDGYRFKGGNPAEASNWEKVQ